MWDAARHVGMTYPEVCGASDRWVKCRVEPEVCHFRVFQGFHTPTPFIDIEVDGFHDKWMDFMTIPLSGFGLLRG